MALLEEEVLTQLKEEFTKLVNPVRLVVFFQTLADPESEQVKRLVEELAALDAKITVEPVNFVLEKERADALGVARTPAIAILGAEKDYGVRFYGTPNGYEFGTLVDAILDVSSGESGSNRPSRSKPSRLSTPAIAATNPMAARTDTAKGMRTPTMTPKWERNRRTQGTRRPGEMPNIRSCRCSASAALTPTTL